MKIEKIEVVNFKGLDSVSAELFGASVYVTGGNESGKTSFIDAVFSALTGQGLPSEPIKVGKKEAKIEVQLDGDLAVVVEFKRDKDKTKQKLTLVQSGEEVKESPRARLNAIVKTIAFDPFTFMSLTPKEKLDYFCKISGINTADIDAEYRENLDLISLDTKELKKHELVPFDAKLADSEPVQATAIVKELTDAQTVNKTIEDFEQKLAALETENVRLFAEVEERQKKIEENITKLNQGKDWVAKQVKIDLAPIQAKVSTIDEENAKIRTAKEAKAGNAKREKLQESIESATEANKKLREKKEGLISGALKGIDGLTFNGEIFLLDGLPFEKEQNNTAAQIIAGLKIGLKMLGEVRIARFDGSLLDKHNREAVREWAKENNLQLFIELVDQSDKPEFNLEILEY